MSSLTHDLNAILVVSILRLRQRPPEYLALTIPYLYLIFLLFKANLNFDSFFFSKSPFSVPDLNELSFV